MKGFHDGCKLQVGALVFLEEVVEVEWVVDIGLVDGCHGIPLHAVLAQQLDGLDDTLPGGLAVAGESVLVMEGLWAVDGEPYEEMVFGKELAPLVVEQRAVGLQAVADLPPLCVTFLQLDGFPIEVQRA